MSQSAILVVGAGTCGKTTLCHTLLGDSQPFQTFLPTIGVQRLASPDGRIRFWDTGNADTFGAIINQFADRSHVGGFIVVYDTTEPISVLHDRVKAVFRFVRPECTHVPLLLVGTRASSMVSCTTPGRPYEIPFPLEPLVNKIVQKRRGRFAHVTCDLRTEVGVRELREEFRNLFLETFAAQPEDTEDVYEPKPSCCWSCFR